MDDWSCRFGLVSVLAVPGVSLWKLGLFCFPLPVLFWEQASCGFGSGFCSGFCCLSLNLVAVAFGAVTVGLDHRKFGILPQFPVGSFGRCVVQWLAESDGLQR